MADRVGSGVDRRRRNVSSDTGEIEAPARPAPSLARGSPYALPRRGASGASSRTDFLGAAPTLAGLSDALRRKLAARSTWVTIPAGEWLFRKGDEGTASVRRQHRPARGRDRGARPRGGACPDSGIGRGDGAAHPGAAIRLGAGKARQRPAEGDQHGLRRVAVARAEVLPRAAARTGPPVTRQPRPAPQTTASRGRSP